MKKLTLLLVAAVMIAGNVDAQSCCKKGGKCTKACAKESKSATTKNASTSKATKIEAPKKTS